MESAGLKEWAIVCQALGRGEQCIILRKGGIAEGRASFAFGHPEFFLFPTFFHEQIEKVRTDAMEIPRPRENEIEIRFFAKVIAAQKITSWETAAALKPLHILREEVVRERFDYDDKPGLHIALVRVFQLTPSWIFPDAPRYGGCRSWVKLPEVPEQISAAPVLSDQAHQERVAKFGVLTGAA
jgi:hypothetical protein